MTAAIDPRAPFDPAMPCMPADGAIWHPDGYQYAVYESVQEAAEVTRYEAARRFAETVCEPVIRVRVAHRYMRVLTLAESYAAHRDRWPDNPEVMPPRWCPDEDDRCWGFVHRDHPDAIPVYVCVEAGGELPPPVSGRGKETRP